MRSSDIFIFLGVRGFSSIYLVTSPPSRSKMLKTQKTIKYHINKLWLLKLSLSVNSLDCSLLSSAVQCCWDPKYPGSLEKAEVSQAESRGICNAQALCRGMAVRSIQTMPEYKLPFKPHEEGITCRKVHIYFSSVSLWTFGHQKGINRSHLWSMFPLVFGDLLFFCLCEAISASWIVLSFSSTVPVCHQPSLFCVWKGLETELSVKKETSCWA